MLPPSVSSKIICQATITQTSPAEMAAVCCAIIHGEVINVSEGKAAWISYATCSSPRDKQPQSWHPICVCLDLQPQRTRPHKGECRIDPPWEAKVLTRRHGRVAL